ncbi:MAG: glycosyltransferase [Phycisphaeraceae bacterium]|nr:glycosyltransferase [Phycisphaeraceae bacterium]
MRVLMLGWEFPPYISGGLGTACYGLTKALSNLNVEVLFVLPRHVQARRWRAVAEQHARDRASGELWHGLARADRLHARMISSPDPFRAALPELPGVSYRIIRSRLPGPYERWTTHVMAATDRVAEPAAAAPTFAEVSTTAAAAVAVAPAPCASRAWIHQHDDDETAQPAPISFVGHELTTEAEQCAEPYGQDLMLEVQRYADRCVRLAEHERFDVIHAHDWMTFPAGIAIRERTGKPLVVHMHSTEFDRSGHQINHAIYDIERRGMHVADSVIAVSFMTRARCHRHYGVDLTRVKVVYNGVDAGQVLDDVSAPVDDPAPATIGPWRRAGEKVVLFLGRITSQKGPQYFIHAAKRVLERMKNVKFVMAGSGDRVGQIIELAAREGIGHRIFFTGFLRGTELDRVFRMADVYVMPSVSEPFGISTLEAISRDVPVIISRSSGVSEVLSHALKVDFWDVDDMANKILAVLRHPPLASTLRRGADKELRRLSWHEAAGRCRSVYEQLIGEPQDAEGEL